MTYYVHCTHPDGRSVGFSGLNKEEAEKIADSWRKDGYECKITSSTGMRVLLPTPQTVAAPARWLTDPELASLINRLHQLAANEDESARFSQRMRIEYPDFKPLILDESHAAQAAQLRRWADMLKKL